jgi:hypothetical protein
VDDDLQVVGRKHQGIIRPIEPRRQRPEVLAQRLLLCAARTRGSERFSN